MRGRIIIGVLLSISLFSLLFYKLPRHFEPSGHESSRILNKGQPKNAKEEAKKLYFKRLDRVKEVCKKRNITAIQSKGGYQFKLWFTYRESLLYCEIGKVSSSTWENHFRELYPEYFRNTLPGTRHSIMKRYFDIPSNITKKQLDEEVLTFAFVRHPLSRLKSAYYESFVRPNWNVTFDYERDLRDFFLVSERNIKDPLSDNHTNPEPEESIRFVLNRKFWTGSGPEHELHAHFRPQWHSCDFCTRHYDVLGTLETFQQDFNFLTRVLRLEDKLKNLQSNKGIDRSVQQFWSKLSEKTKYQVLKYYEEDFDAFGYSREMPT